MKVKRKEAWSLKLNLERHEDKKGETLGFVISKNWYDFSVSESEFDNSAEELEEQSVNKLRRLKVEIGK